MQRNVSWSPPAIGEEEKKAAIAVVNSGWMTQGKKTEEFEKKLADYIGCKHAVVVNSGTSALITAMIAHGIGRGDEVLVPTLTFIASVNAISAVGATPVLVDSDLETFNTTPELMKEKITGKTKAIMPVDVAGMPIDIDSFKDFAEDNDLILVEDAAEAVGAKYKHKKIGSFDHTSILSFHMAKLMSTIEGGCLTTNDDAVAEKCKMIRNHGMQGRYDYAVFGLNSRITDIQSAIGLEQLKKLDRHLELRNKLAKQYMDGLKGLVEFQQIPDYVTLHPWMIFGVLTEAKKRDAINKLLNDNGIGTRICWLPAHKQAYHSKLFKGSYPNAEQIASRIINPPMGNALAKEDVDYVIEKFKEALKK